MAFTPEDVQRLLNNKARKEENRANGIMPPVIPQNKQNSRYAFTPDQVQRMLNNKANKVESSNRVMENKSPVAAEPKTHVQEAKVSAIAEPKSTTFVLPALEEKPKTNLSTVRLSGYQPETPKSLDVIKLPSKASGIPTVSPALTDEQLVEKFLAPDYKLSKSEEKEADRIIRDYRKNNEVNMTVEQARAMREQAADPNSYYNKIIELERKTNDAYAFGLNAVNAVPFLRNIVDRYAEKQNDPTVPTMSEALDITRQQNPVSAGVGGAAGTLGMYMLGGALLGAVPAASTAATKAGAVLQKVPVLGKLGAERLGHVVADTGVDVALDTLPRLVDDLESGKTTGEAAWNAAKNIGGNFAMNVGSDVLGNAVGNVFDGSKKNNISAYTSTKKVVDEKSTTKADYPARNADLTSPFPTSKNEAELTANSNIPTPTADVNEPNAKFMSNAELNNARKELLGDRYDDVMRTSEKNIREESYARNVAKGRVEDVPEEVKNEFIGNPELYEVLSNRDTLAQAQAIYESGNAESQIYRLLSKKEPVAIPLGNQIVKDMIASGRRDEAVELMRSMSNSLREGGQFTQAAAIGMMRSDPKTAMRYVIRDIDDINAIGRKKFGKRWVDVELKDEEIDAFDEIIPGDADAIKEVLKTVNDRVAKEYPSTMWEKVVELSKVSMLLNPRTQIRNLVSNALLSPVRSLTDRVSAVGQHAMHLVNPDIKITQSLVGGGKEEKALANEVWENVRENIMGNSSPKYERGIKGTDRDKQVFKGTVVSRVFDRIFPGAIAKANAKMGKNVDDSLLETARNFTYKLLEMGDEPFVKNNFVNRLASYMKAQGIKSVDDLPEDAISLAAEEALKATFKDDNTMTKVFSDLKRTTGKVGEVVMPFTKTPANLAMRGIDYSPAGIVTAFKMARNKKGASEIMDHIAKNVTGTAAIAVGYVLAKNGIISGALSSDKDEAAFQKQQGQQAYSINVDGNYYSYDWAQPSSIPIILGASIYQSVEESDEEARTALEKFERGWDMTKQATVSAANSWMELSPLQSIADIFNTSYGGSVPENFINEVLEFPQRLVPAALGATARAMDPVQRQTFSSGHPIQTQMNVLKSKVPYLSETLPAARDTWGNEIRRSDTTREAAFAQFANPGQFGNDAKTPIDDEIQRLFDETDNNAVFPRKSNWKVGDTKLTNEQYSELQRQQGQKSYELADAFIGSDVYDSFSDVDRAEIMGNLYGYAKAVAEQEMFGKEMSAANAKLHRIYTDLGAEGIARYYAYKQQADTDGNGGISKKELVPFLDSQPLSRSERRAYFSYLNTGKNPY